MNDPNHRTQKLSDLETEKKITIYWEDDMASRKKTWSYNPPKPKKEKPKVPEEVMQYLQEKGDEIVEKVFKPEYLSPVSEDASSQIVDIYTKWHRGAFYFCAKYKLPPCSRASEENKFVRLEYLGDDLFQYSYMRHTGKWNRTFKMSADECLKHAALEIIY